MEIKIDDQGLEALIDFLAAELGKIYTQGLKEQKDDKQEISQ